MFDRQVFKCNAGMSLYGPLKVKGLTPFLFQISCLLFLSFSKPWAFKNFIQSCFFTGLLFPKFTQIEVLIP